MASAEARRLSTIATILRLTFKSLAVNRARTCPWKSRLTLIENTLPPGNSPGNSAGVITGTS